MQRVLEPGGAGTMGRNGRDSKKNSMPTGFWPSLCEEGEELPLGGVVPNVDPLTESLPKPQPPAATLEWRASAPSRWLEDEWAPDLSWAN